MSLREDVAQIASLLGIEIVTLPQAIEDANVMMGIAGEGTLPTQAQVLLEACNSTTETVKAELDDDEAVVSSAGRDFSGRGDWSAHATTNADDDLEMLPNMQVASSFLEKNSQAHTSAMTALGDIVDNARESGATKLSIDVVDGPDSSTSVAPTSRRGAASNRVLKVSDNGAGMGEGRVLEGMMSIGFTRKDFSTGASGRAPIAPAGPGARTHTVRARTRLSPRATGLPPPSHPVSSMRRLAAPSSVTRQ